MAITSLKVSLLTGTANALDLVYAAYRQCYSTNDAAMQFNESWTQSFDESEEEYMERRKKMADFIEKIMSGGHVSPIEHVSYSFAISGVSRALSHQLVRHRVASYSQQSQRYVDACDFDFILPPHIAAIPEAKARFLKAMDDAAASYLAIQDILIRAGQKKGANEDARFVLPNACETKLVVTMNCRSLLHFFEERCCNRAQWEIRAMANKMLLLCREQLPVVFNLAGAKCERLGYCPEDERFTCGRYPRRNG